jgi:hypothetical protein
MHRSGQSEDDALSLKAIACLVLLGLAVLATAAPQARALEPGPTIFTFDIHPENGATFSNVNGACPAPAVVGGGFDGGPFLRISCPQGLDVAFSTPRALVELFVRVGGTSDGDQLTLTACGPLFCDPITVDTQTLAPAPQTWTPVILRDATGQPSIHSLHLRSTWTVLEVDDIGLSTSTAQPDTEITSAPPVSTRAPDASFSFRANQPGAGFTCTVDGASQPSCPNPLLLQVGPGGHAVAVAARDRWGLVDPSPASHAWTVLAPEPDADGDGVPNSRDNCPREANPEQADSDRDEIGNACEVLPSGDAPPVAGVNTVVRLLSGEVFVKLPRGTTAAQAGGGGFVPLKGVASVPVGSTVDARKGRLNLSAAANSRPVGDRRRRLQAATFGAGIFRIRQARERRGSSRRTPADALLRSGRGEERRCTRDDSPRKGVVRSLTVDGKGYFRTVGGASVAVASNARWITSDRCNGTLTTVQRGRVSVVGRDGGRAVTVRAGRSYLVRARLFAIEKGRRGP